MTANVGLETLNFRLYRRMAWQVLRARYAAAVADAVEDGLPEADARQRSARAVRGELRVLMSELLTHAPVPAVIDFLGAARDWGENGERLLEQGDVIVALVETVEPQAPWQGTAVLGREAADDDVQWAGWVQAWIGAFRATGPAAAAMVPDPPSGGVDPKAEQKSKPSRWVPWALSAAAVVGTTVVVVLSNRE
jgi:hypothetical protein